VSAADHRTVGELLADSDKLVRETLHRGDGGVRHGQGSESYLFAACQV
jgi:hypothetical protein